MMRMNLLRGLPPGDGAPEQAPPPPGSGALKRLLSALLFLLVAGAVVISLTRPEWFRLQRVPAFWKSDDPARADSLHRADIVRQKVSRLVDKRQTDVIEWLHQLEALTADPHQAGAGALTAATFDATGAFILEGVAPSAEALSALQEALVLVPGLDLQQSRATEIANPRAAGFMFRFAGRITAETAPSDTVTGDSAADVDQAPPRPVRDRVVAAKTIPAHLDTLIRTAAGLGVTFAPPRAGDTTRQGTLVLHSWRLKGTLPSDTLAASKSATTDSLTSETSPFAVIRHLWELERHRGSPFAVQRIALSEKDGNRVVFLDILALSP
jgi:hypothetical protein